jgi:serine/threonine protein kinase
LFENIITIHLFYQGNNLKYLLVMEYADGGSLRDYLKNRFESLTWNDKYKLGYQLACAVSCLHEEGIVHRDLVIYLHNIYARSERNSAYIYYDHMTLLKLKKTSRELYALILGHLNTT